MSDPIAMTTVYFGVSTTPLSDSGVTSETSLFIPKWEGLNGAPNDVVCFVGKAEGLQADIASFYEGGGEQCQAANGCGVHVHAGTDCTSTETQLGHWYNNETLSTDPWAIIGYPITNAGGVGAYADCVSTGFDLEADPTQLVGRAFIIHAEDGSRVSCGIIEPKETVEFTISSTTTEPIPGATSPNGDEGVTGAATVFSDFPVGVSDGVCYQGYAMNLLPDVESFQLGGGSTQCDVANGCGAHIHSGTGCTDTEAQGGHYYDGDSVAIDPWLLESYRTTDSTGAAAFVGCALTGANSADYMNRPFIVHGEDGSRLSCGILSATAIIEGGDGDIPPVTNGDDDSSANGAFSTIGALVAASISAVLSF